MRMGKGGETNFPISSINDEQSITATFSITLDNKFLPMQLIYKGKTNESLLEVTFPEEFLLSANEKESLKFLYEFILSYIQQEWKNLRPENQKALIIYEVFCVQTTNKVFKRLGDNNILVINVPSNMTQLFQLLDLTVNKVAKIFMKHKFSDKFTR